MAHITRTKAVCTNKLCKYEGYHNVHNGRRPTEKTVCPACGFKTFSSDSRDVLGEFRLY